MKHVIITFLLCVTGVTALAQDKTNYHLISLEDKKDVPLNYAFYVENVYDGRQFTQNIGTVQKGAFNTKTLANFEKPFIQEIKDYLVKVFPKRDSLRGISLRINDLYVSERTEGMTETGYASVVTDVIEEKNGIQYIIGTYSAHTESNAGMAMDVTGKHDERIKQALIKCLARYEVTAEDEKLNIVFNNEVVEKRQALKPAKGIYFSYADMFKNNPMDDSNFYINSDNDKYYLVNKYTAQKADDYYAFSDGETVFLNVSKYSRSKYYAKTERIGNKYFIDNVLYDSNNALLMSAMFGIVGTLASSNSKNTTIPMLIDCNSGQPFFLSNSEVKTLLSPYPDLLKEYKNSNRTSADIKAVLVKYYALSEPAK